MARIGNHAAARAVRAALIEAVSTLGPDRADADPRLRPLLIDLTEPTGQESVRWVKMLVEAAEIGIVVDLTDPQRRDRAHDRICDETSLSADAAQWAIETWCEALAVEAPPERPPAPTTLRLPPRPRPRLRREPVPEPVMRPGEPLIPDGVLSHTGHEGRVAAAAAAVSDDGTVLATGGDEGTVRLHFVEEQRSLSLEGHDGSVAAVAVGPDGLVASGGADGTARLWDMARGPLAALSDHQAAVTAMAFNPDGSTLATGTADGTIALWEAPGGTLLRTITGHPGAVTALAFRAGGRVLVSGGDDRAVRMWLSETGTRGHVLERRGKVGAVALSGDGSLLAIAGPAGVSVRRFAWPARPKRFTTTLGRVVRGDVFFLTGGEVADDRAGSCSLDFAPDSELVAAGTVNGDVIVWKPGDWADTGRADSHQGPVVAVAFTDAGRRLVSIGADGSARFWRWV